MGPQRWRWEEDDEEEAIGQAEGRFARAEVGNVLRNLQQSLDETIGHPRRNTGYAGSNNSSALLLPGLLFSLPPLPALVSLSLSLPLSLPLIPYLCYPYFVCIFFIQALFTGSLFLFVNISPRFHALFIPTMIVDNVVESENNIGVVASLYCDVVTMYLCRFGGVTIVEAGVIVNAMIKTIMITIAEIVWHCCASLIRICALSKRVP